MKIKSIRQLFSRLLFLAVTNLFIVCFARAEESKTNLLTRSGGYQFDHTVSRQVLENYLARSICIEGMFNGRGPLADDIRMVTNSGAKYIARGLCLWAAERNFLADIQRAKEQIPQAIAADPDVVVEGCVFETVSQKVSEIAIPDWVFKDMRQPIEQRHFRYDDIIYPQGQRRAMGNAKFPMFHAPKHSFGSIIKPPATSMPVAKAFTSDKSKS